MFFFFNIQFSLTDINTQTEAGTFLSSYFMEGECASLETQTNYFRSRDCEICELVD